MKKFFFAALLATTLATSAFATDVTKVDYRITKEFAQTFKNASNVNWISKSTFTKAEFIMNGEKMEAFYNYAGELIGTSRNISIETLPVKAKRAFAKTYSDYTVKEVIHFEGLEDDGYYISAENAKENVILKVTDERNVSVYKRTRK